jgi:hypothetical protein
MIPGANLLGIAFGAIAQQTIQHLSAIGRTQNEVGAWVTEYAQAVDVRVSWQPVDAKKYEQLGLDLAKEYHTIWMKAPISGIQRGKSPDRFIEGAKLHEVVDVKDWYGQDGWVEILVIDIGPAE